jgi:MFS family permease
MQFPSAISRFRSGFARETPEPYRTNFRHLYWDIGWFGVLSGSALSFLTIYMVRIGATPFQIGLVNAGPAIVALAVSLPSGALLHGRRIDRIVYRASIYHRFFYFLWIPLPVLFVSGLQIQLFILIIFLMSLPGTLLSIGFNAFFAEAVPPEYRPAVVGKRNAVFAISFTVTSLLCGYLLAVIPFPYGYQTVFALGILGALWSTFHLGRVRLAPVDRAGSFEPHTLGDIARPGRIHSLGDTLRAGVGLRFLMRTKNWGALSVKPLRGSFGLVLLLLFIYHITQYLPIPLYPIYWVDRLSLTDQEISLGNAIFYMVMFVGSVFMASMARRIGNYGIFVIGAFIYVGYPLLTAFSQGVGLYLAASVVGGLATALAGGALGNYLLERIPENHQSISLAWYMVALNAAILLASIAGPLTNRYLNLETTLILFAGGRAISGLAIWKWGRAAR